MPSSISSRSPGPTAANSSGCGSSTRCASPGSCHRGRGRTSRPSPACAEPPSKLPTRSFGPCRSNTIVVGRLQFLFERADGFDQLGFLLWSPWLMLMRNASAPAIISLRIISGCRRRARVSRGSSPCGRGAQLLGHLHPPMSRGAITLGLAFNRLERRPARLEPRQILKSEFETTWRKAPSRLISCGCSSSESSGLKKKRRASRTTSRTSTPRPRPTATTRRSCA